MGIGRNFQRAEREVMGGGVFITGTDTNVGKTFVVCALGHALKKKFSNLFYFKPIETGCRKRGGKLIPSDTISVLNSLRLKMPISQASPIRFVTPAAPYISAKVEHKKISIRRILSCYKKIRKKSDFVIVEGAGGINVPITEDYFYIDLINDMKIPALLVVKEKLGMINHTLLTLEGLSSRGVEVVGVIFNRSENYKYQKDEYELRSKDIEFIANHAGIKILVRIPFVKERKNIQEIPEVLKPIILNLCLQKISL
ncbi:MAG: dethiobiotin synthase [Acidobacteriota bacterium]